MLKDISNLGTELTITEQQSIHGGDPFICWDEEAHAWMFCPEF